MDIVALSVEMAQTKVLSDVGTAVLSNTLDLVESQGATVASMLEEMPTVNDVYAHIGGNIDIGV